jgi:hypothetical protein
MNAKAGGILMKRLRIVVPVFNDWTSFNILLRELDQVVSTLPMRAAIDRTDFCVVAQRRKRSENLTFKLSYIVYKSIFKLLTARRSALAIFLFSPEVMRDGWLRLPIFGTICRLPYCGRGFRFKLCRWTGR